MPTSVPFLEDTGLARAAGFVIPIIPLHPEDYDRATRTREAKSDWS